MTVSIYRLALHLLPAKLRIKHGASMEVLYLRELDRAREKGAAHVLMTSALGLADVMRRSVYELQRAAGLTINDFNGASNRSHQSQHLLPSVLHSPRDKRPMTNPNIPLPTPRQLLRQLTVTFVVALLLLTSALLYVFGSRQLSQLKSVGDVATALLLATPFTAAMTIPMAVFVAVIVVFARLGKTERSTPRSDSRMVFAHSRRRQCGPPPVLQYLHSL